MNLRTSVLGRVVLSATVAAAAALAVAVVHLPAAEGAYRAGITNSTDTVATNAYFKCSAAQVGETATKAYFAYALGESAGTTAADASGNGRTGTYASSGVTYKVANPSPAVCPRDGQTVITLNGTSGYLVATTGTSITGPNTFTEEIWFKTTTAAGKLIGFGNSNSLTGTTSGQYDRHLYIDSTGVLRFGIYNGGVYTLATSKPVTDGAWHYAAATLSSAGMALYLDGSLAASSTTPTTAESNTAGYWHVGFDNLAGWTNVPSSNYFSGSLADAAVYTVALSAAQIANHYAAGQPS